MTREATSVELRKGMVEAWAANERLNQMILEALDAKAWRAKPPGRNTRTIAAIFTHVHNVRRKWVRLTAPQLKLPKELKHRSCTLRQARKGLAESGRACGKMLAEALEGQVGRFVRDGWARPWPAGAAMFAYMMAHEAHHRGQVCLLAHQLGYPLAKETGYQLWMWEKVWRECGFGVVR
jgi:uncharacterized damage-inducible protein DinB